MANESVTDYAFIINHHLDSEEILWEYLCKTEALIHVALNGDFLGNSHSTAINYLSVLSDLVTKAKVLSEQSINSLIKSRRLLINSGL